MKPVMSPAARVMLVCECGQTLVADIDRVRKAYLERMEETRATFRPESERAGAD